MNAWKALFSLTLMSIPIGGYTSCNGVSSTWNGTGTASSWNDPTNWTPASGSACVPNGVGDTANFIGATPVAITQNVGAISLAQLIFSTQNYSISGPTANTITFSRAGSAIGIVPGGIVVETIDVPVIMNSLSQFININAGAGLTGTVTFGQNVTINSGLAPNATATITNQGNPNIVNFNGPSPSLTINQGFLSNLNSGFSYNGVVGNSMNVASAFELTDGSILENINNSTITGLNGVGASLSFGNSFTVSGGQFTNSNTGAISNQADGSGVRAGSISISAGSITNSNSGAITGSSLASVGSQIVSNSTFDITGTGQVQNLNTGAAAGNNIGSAIIATTSASVSGPNGILLNNGWFLTPTLSVNSGGTVRGTGTFTGVYTPPNPPVTTSVTNSGTIEPFNGSSPGTMTIVGTYTQTPTGILLVDLESKSSFSQLDVVGTAQLAGTLSVDLLPDNKVNPGDKFTIGKCNRPHRSVHRSGLHQSSLDLNAHDSIYAHFCDSFLSSFWRR